MKNETIRTKTQKGFSTRAIALVLCFVMLLTAIGSGSVLSAIAADFEGNGAAVLVDAAKAGADVDAPAPGEAEESSDILAPEDIDDSFVLSKKGDADLVSTGADWDATGKNNLKISFDNGSTWSTFNSDSSGYINFTVPYDCTAQWEYWAEYGGTSRKYLKKSDTVPDSNVVTDATDYWARYVSADGVGTTYEFSASLKAGKYVISYQGFDSYGNTAGGSLKYKWWRKLAKAHGDVTGSWDTYDEMTYDNASGAYYYEFSGNGSSKYFRVQRGDNGTYKDYQPNTNTFDLVNGTDGPYDGVTNKYDAFTYNNGSNSFYIPTVSGNTYRVWFSTDWNNSNKVWYTDETNVFYYLTGYINGEEETSQANQFTASGGSYTFTLSSTTAEQYVTILDSDGNVYHAPTVNAGSGTSTNSGSGADGTNTSINSDNKWMVESALNKTVTFTWAPSTKTLSWTVTSSGGGSTGWLYSGVAAASRTTVDPTSGLSAFTASDSTTYGKFRFMYGSTDTGLNTALVPSYYATPSSSSEGNPYWAELTGAMNGTTGQFYFGLCNYSNKGNLVGNNSEEINDASVNDGTDVTIKDKDNNLLFKIQRKQNNNVSSSARYVLIYDIQWSRVSAIGVKAYDNSKSTSSNNDHDGKVDYQIYYKAISSGDDVEGEKVKVYAKDGAAPIDWNNKGSSGATDTSGTAYNYAAIGDTNMYSDSAMTTRIGTEHTDDGSDYWDANVEVGSTIYIKTTISSTYRSRYYVRGFCVNGVTYYGAKTSGANTSTINETVDSTNGVYTLTYTIPPTQTDPIEITPIYYIVKSGNTVTCGNTTCELVTFYLQGYDQTLQDAGWGNTPYVYPFYGDLENINNSFGCYPGQPMVYVGGTYSMEVPVKNVKIAGGSYTPTVIKGITVSNGYADHVHRNEIYKWSDSGNDAAHKQTYDFDDFYKIYNEKLDTNNNHPNTITLQLKYENDTFNASTYGQLAQKWQRVYTHTLTATEVNTTIPGSNGWEYLKNFKGQYVDIFGNALSSQSEPSSVGLYAISTGYNANIAGDYGTAWMMFDGSSRTQIVDTTNARYAIPPSVLTMNYTMSGSTAVITNEAQYPKADRSVAGAGSYTDEINKYAGILGQLDAYKGQAVKITYESDHQDIRNKILGDGAYRMDGRWLYTYATDYVSAEVKIEYFNNSTGDYTEEASYTDNSTDSRTNSIGSNTGCEVYFDSSTGADSRHSGDRLIKSGTYSFHAVAASGWKFVGWEAEVDGKRQPMTGMGADVVSLLAEHNGVIYARFDPINSGSLKINHTALTGDALGSGTVDLKVEYDGAIVKNYGAGAATATYYLDGTKISNDSSLTNKVIKIYLKAIPSKDDTFNEFGLDRFNTAKSSDITVTTGSPSGSGTAADPKEYSFSFKVGDLYATGGKQTYSILNYTSSFNRTDHKYNFTFNFPSRGSATNDKSITVRGIFSSDEFDSQVNYSASSNWVSEAFIKDKAPFESNFNQTLTLNEEGYTVTQSKSDVTYSATVTYKSKVTTYKAVFDLPYENYGSSASGSDIDSNAVKAYTGQKTANTVDGASVNIVKAAAATSVEKTDITYGDYITFNGSNVSKDTTTVNHTTNNFITAPEKILDDSTVKYFSYWAVYDYNDWKAGKDEEDMTLVTKVFYTDFHDRIYGNYYIKPVYGTAAESFLLANTGSGLSANILFLESSRNQWNAPASGTTDSAATAADLIYNDFAFSFTNNGKIISEQSDKSNYEVGMVIQRVYDSEKSKYASGDSTTDMSYYRAKYQSCATSASDSTNTDAGRAAVIQSALANGNRRIAGHVVVHTDSDGTEWINGLNNKNRLEKYYSFYSQSGQTVDDTNYTINFMYDNAVDNYVYRAFAYIKAPDGTIAVSTQPAYFSMKYVSGE